MRFKVASRVRGLMREDDRTGVSETRPDRQYRMPPCPIHSQFRGAARGGDGAIGAVGHDIFDQWQNPSDWLAPGAH